LSPSPYHIFENSFLFEKHFMTINERNKTLLLGTPKTKKQEKDEVVHRENKTFRPPYFQISYILHFLFVLNNLKSYGNII
jgi:hypothetical protein